MILDNETVNKVIRSQLAPATFSRQVQYGPLLDENGNVFPGREDLPLVDALNLLVQAGIALHPELVHPVALAGIKVSAESLRNLLVSLVRVEPAQPSLFVTPQQLKKDISAEIKNAVGAHTAAKKILGYIASKEELREKLGERFRSTDVPSMDDFEKMLAASPNPELTKALLIDAGPECPAWMSPGGPLPPLDRPIIPTLVAMKPLDISVKVLYVRDKQDVAIVEITRFESSYSQRMLSNVASEVELKFLNPSARDDLVLFQYCQWDLPIRVSATCATHPKFAKKTALTLKKVLLSREKLDAMHGTLHQLELPNFEPVPDGQ